VYADNATSGFEVVHGALERCLAMIGPKAKGSRLTRVSDPSFLDGRCAAVVLPDGTRVGTLGTVHPEVLTAFDVDFPCSAADLDLEAFL
jgi:phenylalanyl-tRNA synthetase beta chain